LASSAPVPEAPKSSPAAKALWPYMK
jgi:hypothetical protein